METNAAKGKFKDNLVESRAMYIKRKNDIWQEAALDWYDSHI